MSGDLGYVPAAQSLSLESDQDSSLESDFRMALRKLTKRDVVTKLKVGDVVKYSLKNNNNQFLRSTLYTQRASQSAYNIQFFLEGMWDYV